MFLSIRKGAAPAADGSSERPVALLLACHGRIRSFTELAIALASRAAATPKDEVAEAARSLDRYHRIALPLHEADEDCSLRPRLAVASAASDVLDALASVEEEHRQIDALVAELLASWSALAVDPRSLPAVAPRIAGPTEALASLWAPHLTREEAIVFPAVDLLPAETQRLIASEMRARRAPLPAAP